MPSTLFRAVTTCAAVLVLATACSSTSPDAITVGTGSPAATISESPGANIDMPTSAPPMTEEPLTKAQLTAALPPAKALGPKGWKVVKSTSTPGKSKDKIAPASCQDVYSSLSKTTPTDKFATAEREYRGSELGPVVGIGVASYTTVPSGTLTNLAAAVTRCPSFTSTSPKGVKSTWKASPLKFPNLGDETFAMRLSGTTKQQGFSLTFTADVAITVTGTTVVTVTNVGIGKIFLPSSSLTAMKATLARLPQG